MNMHDLISDMNRVKEMIGGMGKSECVLAYAFVKDQIDRADRVKQVCSTVMDDLFTRLRELGVNMEDES